MLTKFSELLKPVTMEPGKFFITLLNAATFGHVLHLQSKSYAEHKALQTFYSDLPDLVDSVIEAWQGVHGKILEYPDQTVRVAGKNDSLVFLKYIQKFVIDNRECVGKETELQNLTDNIAELIDSTIYKLTFLK